MTIDNLVFKGGGVLGAAYAGAITALEDEGKLQGVKAVAGTSAGSLVALLLSLKYSPIINLMTISTLTGVLSIIIRSPYLEKIQTPSDFT
jgi:predicted acylesterase/phospholipase RssA